MMHLVNIGMILIILNYYGDQNALADSDMEFNWKNLNKQGYTCIYYISLNQCHGCYQDRIRKIDDYFSVQYKKYRSIYILQEDYSKKEIEGVRKLMQTKNVFSIVNTDLKNYLNMNEESFHLIDPTGRIILAEKIMFFKNIGNLVNSNYHLLKKTDIALPPNNILIPHKIEYNDNTNSFYILDKLQNIILKYNSYNGDIIDTYYMPDAINHHFWKSTDSNYYASYCNKATYENIISDTSADSALIIFAKTCYLNIQKSVYENSIDSILIYRYPIFARQSPFKCENPVPLVDTNYYLDLSSVIMRNGMLIFNNSKCTKAGCPVNEKEYPVLLSKNDANYSSLITVADLSATDSNLFRMNYGIKLIANNSNDSSFVMYSQLNKSIYSIILNSRNKAIAIRKLNYQGILNEFFYNLQNFLTLNQQQQREFEWNYFLNDITTDENEILILSIKKDYHHNFKPISHISIQKYNLLGDFLKEYAIDLDDDERINDIHIIGYDSPRLFLLIKNSDKWTISYTDII